MEVQNAPILHSEAKIEKNTIYKKIRTESLTIRVDSFQGSISLAGSISTNSLENAACGLVIEGHLGVILGAEKGSEGNLADASYCNCILRNGRKNTISELENRLTSGITLGSNV